MSLYVDLCIIIYIGILFLSIEPLVDAPGLSPEDGELLLVRTQLKWFNTTKGFGFTVPEEDPCDAFIHITTLQEAGVKELGEGAVIQCMIVKGPKGALVTKVEELIDPGTSPTAITHRIDMEGEELQTMDGTVKWYKPDKGFGFIIPEDGMKDVFVHKTCLEKHEIDLLIPGQKVRMIVRSVDKGREVVDFDITEK